MAVKKKRPIAKLVNQPEQLNIILEREVAQPLWLGISVAAQLGGIGVKTIRRAIEQDLIKFKIEHNRYLIHCTSLIRYLNSRTKLKNKFDTQGLGQYVKKWN
ncbi:MAG: hypothetical protein V1765_02430 [bacterium]